MSWRLGVGIVAAAVSACDSAPPVLAPSESARPGYEPSALTFMTTAVGSTTSANAARLLIAATGFSPGRAQAELNWYSQERGYPLSYLVGNHLVWQLKRDYQRALAGTAPEREIDQGFHRLYLESGNMPVSMLRRVFEHRLQRGL